MKLKLIYIAGPFTGPHAWAIAQNVRAAETCAVGVVEAGAMPVIPHTITRNFEGLASLEFWYEGTLELLRRCDGVYMVPGWETSRGVKAEREEARRLKLPVFEDFVHLEMWLRKGGADGDHSKSFG